MRSVHAIASSHPPPSAKPLIAAMTGFPRFSMRSKTCWPASACSRPLLGVWTASSAMSAPATNDRSPAPVSTIARIDSSALSSSIARCSSSSVREFNAFSTFGRLMVRTATAPSRSTIRCSNVMRSERKGVHQPAEDEGRHDEPAEHQAAKPQLFDHVVLGDDREHQRHEEGEQDEEDEVAVHHVRGSLPAERDIEGVDHHEQVQQTGDDEKRVAVFVGHRADVSHAISERARDEVRQAYADV